jgi:hypothetical protein
MAINPTKENTMQNQRDDVIRVVESYVDGLGNRDLSAVPFAPDFTFESPLLPDLTGRPRLVGEPAIEFLRGLFPLIRGTRTRQHIVEGPYCVTLFDLDTIHGTIPVLDRFHVVDGKLKLANPFYDPRPITNATPTQ